ncbi:MAG: SH3 domain-containing protein [Anaerolineae bacterium]
MRRVHIMAAFALLVVAALACNLGAEAVTPTPEGGPATVISDPASGVTVAAGEELSVQSTSTDDAGVARGDLQVDGAVVRSDTVPEDTPQPQFSIIQGWTPDTPGEYTLTVTAYREDGTAGDPASITVTVEEASAEEEEESSEPEPCVARANVDLNVRQGPSVAYPILRVLGIGQQAPVTGHNGDRSWWQIDGSGWISAPYTSVSGDCESVQVASFPPPPQGGQGGDHTATPSYTPTGGVTVTPTYTATPTYTGTPTATAKAAGSSARKHTAPNRDV